MHSLVQTVKFDDRLSDVFLRTTKLWFSELSGKVTNQSVCDNKALRVAQMHLQNARTKLVFVCKPLRNDTVLQRFFYFRSRARGQHIKEANRR